MSLDGDAPAPSAGCALLDMIRIHLVPVLLGAGRRMSEHLGGAPVRLERTRMIESPGATHLRFRVVRDPV
jgi:hypothetical protein